MKQTHLSTQAILLVLVGAIGYSSKAIFIKLAYRYGADSVSLVALRMAFSLPFFLLAAWWDQNRKRKAPRVTFTRRHWLHLIVLGLLGYYCASLLDFWSLQYLSAGLARLILFVYPTLVVLLSAIFLKRSLQWGELGALLLTYLGVAIAFSQSVEMTVTTNFWWGVLLSFGSALSYALYLIGSGEYLPHLGTLRYTAITMTIACIAILLHHGVVHHWNLFHFPVPVYYLCASMAILATVVPAFMVAEGIRVMGAGPTSIISSIGPISTIMLASFILGEQFGIWQWAGALLVISGVVWLSRWKKK